MSNDLEVGITQNS